MRKISSGQRKTLADFFTNAAVAWLGGSVITPFVTQQSGQDVFIIVGWGLSMMMAFLAASLWIMKGVSI